jgi:hypothetical protein
MKFFKKISLTVFAAILFIALVSFSAQQYFNLKFSEEALNKHFQNLTVIKQIAEKSNMAHQEVLFISASVDSLQKDIVDQVRRQQAQQPAPPASKK